MTIEMKAYYIDRHGEKRDVTIVEGYFLNNRSTSRFIDELIKEYDLEAIDYYNNEDDEICVIYIGDDVINSNNHEYEYELILTGLKSWVNTTLLI